MHLPKSRSREALAARTPGIAARVVAAQGGVSVVAFVLLSALLPLTGLGVWSIPIVLGATLLVLLAEVWLDAAASSRRIGVLQDEVRDLEQDIDRLKNFEARTQELEGERIELRRAAEDLRAQVNSPVSLQELLGHLGLQANLVDLVVRHHAAFPETSKSGRRSRCRELDLFPLVTE
jgi:hypothetical protein